MTIAAGTRLGPYEVIAPLGRGGMGEVWRARDTRLGREVALKTLPPEFASDPDRLARFQREAKLLASLNHPHVGTIHGLEEIDGTTALVLELVDGDTLAERLRGPVAPRDAVDLGIQICTALEAAHEKGIIHRDLKPANIKITPEGLVKVLDFGLAKAFDGRHADLALSHSPTLSLAATQAGIILGTAAYMSPEQASGGIADRRSDIWAFGVVLFEMLSGRPAFGGDTVSHVLAAVLATEPPWDALPAALHPRLRELLERCLAKKPADRYRDIADVRADLERIRANPEGIRPQAAGAAPHARGVRLLVPVLATVAACAAAALLAGWMLWPRPDPGPVMRFSVSLPEGQAFTRPEFSTIAISPDGTRLAYVANNEMYVRNLDETEPRLVARTGDGFGVPASPVFSPDGQWLAYVSFLSVQRAQVKRVAVAGGAAMTLFESTVPAGLSWPTPDSLVFASAQGIVRLSPTGGAPEVLVPRQQGEWFDDPVLVGNGDQVVFTRAPGEPPTVDSRRSQIVIQRIGDQERRILVEGATAARVLPSGHLVYVQDATIFAVGFDAASRAVRGGAIPLVGPVRAWPLTPAAQYAVSATGTLVSIPAPAIGPTTAGPVIRTGLVWVDRNGAETDVPVRLDDYGHVRIAPDGTRVALVVGNVLQNSTAAIWLMDVRTGNLRLLTDGGVAGAADGPVWSSDSQRLYFRQFQVDGNGVHAIDVESGERTVVASASPAFPFPLPWSLSPDDGTLAVVNAATLEDINIAALSLRGGRTFTRLLHEAERYENEPAISRNGAWIAYEEAATPAGPFEINLRPFPEVTRTRIPVAAGRHPVFAGTGSELFFFDGDGIASVPIDYEPTLRVGTPRQLFRGKYLFRTNGRAWDVDPSGRRFLMIRQPETPVAHAGAAAERSDIDVVLNWAEEVKARVPVR